MIVAAAVLAAGPVWAQGPHGKQGHPGKGFKQLFQEADVNHDGNVTFDELKAVRPGMTQERYTKLDRNGDGTLDDKDLARGKRQLVAKLKQADANKDGKVTYSEAKTVFPKMTEEKFKQRDRNGDGALSPEDRRPKS